MDEHTQVNRLNWDERVDSHVAAASYRYDAIADDPEVLSGVVRFDRDKLGVDVRGQRLLHLQCHIGTDTVSWGKLGAAEVVGYDFSAPALAAASALAERAGVNARWFEGEFHDAPKVIGDEQFDIVYTGVGATCWLPSIGRWAEVVDHFLAPGGTFYIREGHPVLWALDYDETDPLRIIHPYFEVEEPLIENEDGTYADASAKGFESTTTACWNHGIAETINALLRVGLVFDAIDEYRFSDWQPFEDFQMIDEELGHYALPEDRRALLPCMWSLRMRKPG